MDLPGGAAGQLRLVGHHDDGGARGVDPLQQIEDLAGHGRIQVPGGLVRQDQPRLPGEGSRDGHALLLPPRELGGHVLHARAEPDQVQGLLDGGSALAAPQPPVPQRDVHVVEDVQIGDQVERLKDEPDLRVADPAHLDVAQAAHVNAVQVIPALLEGIQEPRDVQEGGLAGSRGSHDGDELAAVDLDRELAQGMGLDVLGPIDLRDVFHLEHSGFSRGLNGGDRSAWHLRNAPCQR
jgi:hypothetical protein